MPPPLQSHRISLTHRDLFMLTVCVCIWCHWIHGRNKWIHSSLRPYNSIQLEVDVFIRREEKLPEKTGQGCKTKIKFTLPRPRKWIVDWQTWMPPFLFFFWWGGQNKFQACLCRSKNQLNTKVERSTKTSFTVPLQADNCKDSEHPMHRLAKAGESDNSIYAGLLSSCGKNSAAVHSRTTLDRWKHHLRDLCQGL